MNPLPNYRSRIRWRIRWMAIATAMTSMLASGVAATAAQADRHALGVHVAALAHKQPKRKSTYIVQFKNGVSPLQANNLVRSHGGHVLDVLPIIHGFAARMSANAAWELGGNYAVKGLSLNMRVHRTAASVDAGHLASNYDANSQATNAWADGWSGQGVGVAVIDTGIQGDLPDFQTSTTDPTSRVIANAVVNPDATTGGDGYGHGTDVAGIIAGNSWNRPNTPPEKGNPNLRGAYIGIAPQANLIAIKAGDEQGNATTLDVINGLQFAVDHQADYNIRVVNLSLSSDTPQSYTVDPLDAAAEAAWFNGIVVVAAAGNLGTAPDAVNYAPANDPYVLTVGAADTGKGPGAGDDTVAAYSSRGVTQDGFAKPDVYAPGSHIVSTLSPGSAFSQMCPGCVIGGSYIQTSGTSMAAPVVSGGVALMLQANPTLTPDQVKGAIVSFARPMGGPGAGPKGTYRELTIKPSIDHAVHLDHLVPANQGLTPSTLLTSANGGAGFTRSSWRNSNWSAAVGSLTAAWARSSWRCECSATASNSVDPTRSSWSRSTWSTDLTAN